MSKTILYESEAWTIRKVLRYLDIDLKNWTERESIQYQAFKAHFDNEGFFESYISLCYSGIFNHYKENFFSLKTLRKHDIFKYRICGRIVFRRRIADTYTKGELICENIEEYIKQIIEMIELIFISDLNKKKEAPGEKA